MLPSFTVVKPGHTGIHRDDSVIELGTRPGLHRECENMINLVETKVYQHIFTGANRGRFGTVRTGL